MKHDNVSGYEGYYISPRGHFYSRIDPQGRITPRLNKKGTYVKLKWRKKRLQQGTGGYIFTTIQKNHHTIHLSIHRLVAKVYIPNPNNLPVVMHLDNDRTNNRVSNLKWGTVKENVQQTVREGRHKHGSKYDVQGIIQAKLQGKSSKEVATQFNISRRYTDIFWKRYRDNLARK